MGEGGRRAAAATASVATSDDNSASTRSVGRVITGSIKAADSMADFQCYLLDPSSIETAESTLQLTPAKSLPVNWCEACASFYFCFCFVEYMLYDR